MVINPRCTCAVRVTVLGLDLCVCVCVTPHLTFHEIICAKNDTNLLKGRGVEGLGTRLGTAIVIMGDKFTVDPWCGYVIP